MLSQKDAAKLMGILKKINDPHLFIFPQIDRAQLDIVSENGKHSFPTNIIRGRNKNPNKASFTLRLKAPDNPILYRLDINGPSHTNPDLETVGSSHLHIYREGYNDAWAIPVPEELSTSNVPAEALIDFLVYCNIKNTEALAIGGDLFK